MKRICIAYGQPSQDDRPDVNDVLEQVDLLRNALSDDFAVLELPVGFDLADCRKWLFRQSIDAVCNLVEEIDGQGRFIALFPLMLEEAGIPYSGCSADALYVSSNKVLAKRMMSLAGIRTPAIWRPEYGVSLPAEMHSKRLIKKSVWEHASIGIDDEAVCDADSTFNMKAVELSKGWFYEEFIDGREINVSLIDGPQGVRILPPAEICFDAFPAGKPKLVSWAAKWDKQSFEYQNTPRSFDFLASDRSLLLQIEALARQCWDFFGLRGYARVDFRIDANGLPWVLEVNANPCLSPDSGFFAACQQGGVSLEKFFVEYFVELTRNK